VHMHHRITYILHGLARKHICDTVPTSCNTRRELDDGLRKNTKLVLVPVALLGVHLLVLLLGLLAFFLEYSHLFIFFDGVG
jgi:hypothetical protein